MRRLSPPLWLLFGLSFGLSSGLSLAGCREPHDSTEVDAAPADARPDSSDPSDGTPVRLPCTGLFGSGLSAEFGRLDGILVAIVPPGSSGCNSDSDHVHLQVRVEGSVYDVAVNVDSDVYTAAREMSVSTLPWAEGWHTGVGFSYPGIGVRSGDFHASSTLDLVVELLHELETVNHISIYGTGYGESGAHLIHRNNGSDGAIITHPLSSAPRVRMYRFANQTF